LQGNQEKLHHGREIKKNYTMANLKFGENDIQSTVRDVNFLKLVYLAIYPNELFIQCTIYLNELFILLGYLWQYSYLSQ